MSETSSSPKRPRLDFDENSSKDEHFEKYNRSRDRERDQDDQSNYSHSHKHRKRAADPVEEDDGKDEEGKTKLNSGETARREHTLVMRLTNKEQELQDCMNQIQEMKQAQTQNTAQLRSMLLDPAINLVFQRMAKEMDDHKDKLKQKQNELTAWKFTPDSQTGMRVMARCRMLLQENQELGKMISSGRTARLEGEIVLQKALATEMKKNQKELDEFVGELEEDVDGMQGMILLLRQQLKEAQEQIARLQSENEQLRTLSIPPDPEPGGNSLANSSAATPTHTWSDAEQSSGVASSTLPGSSLQDTSVKTEPVDPTAAQKNTVVSSSPARTSEPDASVSLSSGVDHFLSAAQPFEEFGSGSFASKVTPDSGVQTQEEEDISMDASDVTLTAAHRDTQQQPSQTCDKLQSVQKIADQKTRSKDNHANDLTIPIDGQQATVTNSLSEKVTPEPVTKEDSNCSQSSDHQSNVLKENDHLRTTIVSATNAASSITNCSSHPPLPTSTQTSTHEIAETEAATDSSVQGDSSTQGSNNATARIDENSSHLNDEVSVDQTASQQETVQDENKSLGLDINVKGEEDKMGCQTALGLVNGSAKTHD